MDKENPHFSLPTAAFLLKAHMDQASDHAFRPRRGKRSHGRFALTLAVGFILAVILLPYIITALSS